jgi:hypothetical protein
VNALSGFVAACAADSTQLGYEALTAYADLLVSGDCHQWLNEAARPLATSSCGAAFDHVVSYSQSAAASGVVVAQGELEVPYSCLLASSTACPAACQADINLLALACHADDEVAWQRNGLPGALRAAGAPAGSTLTPLQAFRLWADGTAAVPQNLRHGVFSAEPLPLNLAACTGVTDGVYPVHAPPPSPTPPPRPLPAPFPSPLPPLPPPTYVYVVGTVALSGYSVTTFGPAQASSFKQGVGSALGTPTFDVTITSVTTASRRRLLLQTTDAEDFGVNVGFSVQALAATSGGMVNAVRTSIKVPVLRAAGLANCTRVSVVGAPGVITSSLGDVTSSLLPATARPPAFAAAPPAAAAGDQTSGDGTQLTAVVAAAAAGGALLLASACFKVYLSRRRPAAAAPTPAAAAAAAAAAGAPRAAAHTLAPANSNVALGIVPACSFNPCVLCRSITEPLVLNLPCNHANLCSSCTTEFRQANGNVCNECRAASSLVNPVRDGNCCICQDAYRHRFCFWPCAHMVCVGCAVGLVRAALGNAEEKFPFRCETCRDTARMERRPPPAPLPIDDLLRRLPRLRTEIAAAGMEPLTGEEMARFRRFNEEFAIPGNQRVYCPQARCSAVMAVDPDAAIRSRARGGELKNCRDCAASFCLGCSATPWHAGMTCTQHEQARSDTRDAATEATILQTTRACPHCGLRITHYRGHACHHIRPGQGCQRCGTHWCYCCGQRWLMNEHRCPSGCELFCDDSCACPDCPSCSSGRPCTGLAHCDNDGGCRVCQPNRRPFLRRERRR